MSLSGPFKYFQSTQGCRTGVKPQVFISAKQLQAPNGLHTVWWQKSILATRCSSRFSHLHTTSNSFIKLDRFHLCSKAYINDLARAVLIARAYCKPEVTVRPAASHKSTTLPHQQFGSAAMCFQIVQEPMGRFNISKIKVHGFGKSNLPV